MLSCEIIKDLLPLYYDGVCTPESLDLVYEYLHKCGKCRKHLSKIAQAEQISNSLFSKTVELRKAAHLRSLKQSLNLKLVLSAIVGFLSVFVIHMTLAICIH